MSPTAAKPRAKKPVSLGVDWYLPLPGGGYARRAFATTTPASAYLIETLAYGADSDGPLRMTPRTWGEIAAAILFDDEAKAVAVGFIEAGLGEVYAIEHLAARD